MPAIDDIAAEAFLAPVGTPIVTGDCQIIERPGWYQIITPSIRHPGKNEVIHSVIEADIDRLIDEMCNQYDELELPFKWCLGCVRQRLENRRQRTATFARRHALGKSATAVALSSPR